VTFATDATTALAVGDVAGAAALAEAMRPHVEGRGERFTTARFEWVLGMLAEVRGDLAAAYGHVERGHALVEELGMHQAISAQRSILARLAERMGDEALAEHWRSAVGGSSGGAHGDATVSRYDQTVMASRHNVSGLLARASGHPDDARRDHLEALALFTEAGVATGLAHSHSCLGFLASDAGDGDDAAVHHLAALDAVSGVPAPAVLALALEGIASVVEPGAADVAARLLGAARTLWAGASGVKPSHRPDVEAVADRLGARLGPEVFAEAVEVGRSLPGPEAVNLARRAIAATRVGHGGTK
jgi:hypothetical protein